MYIMNDSLDSLYNHRETNMDEEKLEEYKKQIKPDATFLSYFWAREQNIKCMSMEDWRKQPIAREDGGRDKG